MFPAESNSGKFSYFNKEKVFESILNIFYSSTKIIDDSVNNYQHPINYFKLGNPGKDLIEESFNVYLTGGYPTKDIKSVLDVKTIRS